MKSVTIGIDHGTAFSGMVSYRWYVWSRTDTQRVEHPFVFLPGWREASDAAEAATNLGDFLADNGIEVTYEPDDGELDALLKRLEEMGR